MKKQFQEDPVLIKDLSDFKNLRKDFNARQSLIFYCKICGKLQRSISQAFKNDPRFLCKTHRYEETLIKEFGVKNVSQIPAVKLKKEQTCKKHFGVSNPSKCKEIQNKKVQTNLRKFGSTNIFNSKIFKEDLKSHQEKSKETCKKKYGEEFFQSSKIFKNSKEIVEKRESTTLKRFGVKTCLQLEDVRKKSRCTGKYKFESLSFDSSWELALWIYAKDHNEEIVREPCSFEYFFENKRHFYYPDFLYKGNLIELKGPQFFKDGRMICPFDPSKGGLYQAKYECMVSNNVYIWQEKDVSFALNYVKEKYGKDYLKGCKVF